MLLRIKLFAFSSIIITSGATETSQKTVVVEPEPSAETTTELENTPDAAAAADSTHRDLYGSPDDDEVFNRIDCPDDEWCETRDDCILSEAVDNHGWNGDIQVGNGCMGGCVLKDGGKVSWITNVDFETFRPCAPDKFSRVCCGRQPFASLDPTMRPTRGPTKHPTASPTWLDDSWGDDTWNGGNKNTWSGGSSSNNKWGWSGGSTTNNWSGGSSSNNNKWGWSGSSSNNKWGWSGGSSSSNNWNDGSNNNNKWGWSGGSSSSNNWNDGSNNNNKWGWSSGSSSNNWNGGSNNNNKWGWSSGSSSNNWNGGSNNKWSGGSRNDDWGGWEPSMSQWNHDGWHQDGWQDDGWNDDGHNNQMGWKGDNWNGGAIVKKCDLSDCCEAVLNPDYSVYKMFLRTENDDGMCRLRGGLGGTGMREKCNKRGFCYATGENCHPSDCR